MQVKIGSPFVIAKRRMTLIKQGIDFYDGATHMRCDMKRAGAYQGLKHKREDRHFGKSKSCPSTYQLLNYHRTCRTPGAQTMSAVSNLEIEHTALHLSLCDFCSAEFELLLHHPPADPAPTFDCDRVCVPMPAHLYALARTLLFNSSFPSPNNFIFHRDDQPALQLVDSG